MAVDTRNKRFSMLGLGQARGCPLVFPNPDGSFDAADRAQLDYLYQGISLAAPDGTVAPQNMFFRRRRSE